MYVCICVWYTYDIHIHTCSTMPVYSAISSCLVKAMLCFQAWREKQVKINLSLKRVGDPQVTMAFNSKSWSSILLGWFGGTLMTYEHHPIFEKPSISMANDMLYVVLFEGKTTIFLWMRIKPRWLFWCDAIWVDISPWWLTFKSPSFEDVTPITADGCFHSSWFTDIYPLENPPYNP